MIARLWHGWTGSGEADAYEELLRARVLPGIAARGIDGYRGAHVLRRRQGAGDGVEFLVITWFDSIDAVHEFAGADPEASVVPPEARALLSRFEDRSTHYETVLAP